MTNGSFKICPPFKKTLGFRLKLFAIRYSFFGWLALRLAHQIENGRRRYLRMQVIRLKESIGPRDVTLRQKVSAAIFIVAHGAEGSGVGTHATLMHPMREFNLDDVDLESSRLLGSVMGVLLEGLPQSQIDRLLQDQAERFSSDYVF